MEPVSWNARPRTTSDLFRRLAQCEAVLGQITTGVVILEPRHDDEWSLELTMVNDVAAAYLGRVGHAADRLVDTEGGLRACGLFELAQLVSLTSQEHLQEDLCAPGAAAAGSRIDLAITPLGDGAVSITFEDVSHRDSARSQ